MRDEQRERLNGLSVRLTDTVLRDADPANWVGDGKTGAQMTKQERGDAVWCRKLAVQSLTVLGRVQHLLNNERDNHHPGEESHDPETEIAAAEAEAEALLARVMDDHRPRR